VDGSGVDTTNQFWNAVTKAASGGYVTNTVGLPFGYFLSAQGCGEAVAYWALNRATAVYATTVGTNGPVVPMDTNGISTMPAVYAQAYQGGNGRRYLLLTNKGSNAVPVQIKIPLKSLAAGRYVCQLNVVDRIGRKFTFPRTNMIIQ